MELSLNQIALLEFVKSAHGDQKRKYTDDPYWSHVYAVAEILHESGNVGHGEIEIALCHDLFEDTGLQAPELLLLLIRIGYPSDDAVWIINAVTELTDVYTYQNYPQLNRAERKALEAARLHEISPIAQTVKYADMIHNSTSIAEHDKDFAPVYFKEKKKILDGMKSGDNRLYKECYARCMHFLIYSPILNKIK